MISLYFHSCQPLLLQMSNSIQSLATCQGIEPYCGNVPKTKIFWRGHHANSIGRQALAELFPLCCLAIWNLLLQINRLQVFKGKARPKMCHHLFILISFQIHMTFFIFLTHSKYILKNSNAVILIRL